MSFGTIYTHQPNPRTTGILAVAKAYGLKLDIIYTNTGDQQAQEKLLQLNPLGQVPVFVGADGYVLTESMAIALYIASQKTSSSSSLSLLGPTPTLQSKTYHTILRFMSLANSDLLPAQGGIILPLLHQHVAVRKNTHDCLRAFYADCRVLETQLTHTKFLVGDALTLADLYVAGMLVFGFMVLHPVLKREYPQLTRWMGEMYRVPVFAEVAGERREVNVEFPRLEDEDVKDEGMRENGEEKANGTTNGTM